VGPEKAEKSAPGRRVAARVGRTGPLTRWPGGAKLENMAKSIVAKSTDAYRDDGPSAAGVVATGLVKRFGAVEAVRGVDLSIDPGETVALLGPNGAGKSTTIDMLLGLARPDAGTVRLFGRTPAEAVAAGRVGGMLQVGSLIRDLTVRELVVTMASLYPHPLDPDRALELAGLGDVAGRRTQKLSGGQTQRVRFAVALVADPDLLVLDEPTVALDVEARRDFWTAMRHVAESGKTVLFATHYLEEADAYADRIVLMARGRVVADGPTTEIKARVGFRTIRATLPGADPDVLRRLPGVAEASVHGLAVELRCADSDVALRALLAGHADASDIEVRGAGLEEAFLQLTGDTDLRDTDLRDTDLRDTDLRDTGAGDPGSGETAATRLEGAR
jgi:ABC-2 type transport system ATP-binding protein